MGKTCPSGSQEGAWSVVVRDQEAVVAGLARGECDGILADDVLEPDQVVQTALEEGFLDWFEDFADRRQRHSIEKRLFCRVLCGAQLLDLRSVRQAGRVIFHSATLLDKLGFNFRLIREGGRRTGDYRLFDEEALEDFFAKLTPRDYLAHQLRVSRRLLARPELAGEVWLLDCQDTKVPAGHHQEERHWKAGVLSVCTRAGPRPVLWNFGPAPATSDLALGRPLVKLARRVWGARRLRWLIVDAGFVDGPWMRWLKERGTDTILRLREGMDHHEAALRAGAGAPAGAWERVPLPKRRPREARPVRRDVLGLPDQPGWETLGLPIARCLVRDTYPDKVVYWLLMSTHPEQSARAIYELFRRRGGIEENFMALARYHGLNAIQACREGLALARLHFSLLAYTLRHLCRGVHSAETLPRTRFLLVYWAGCYALLHASEVFTQVFAHWEEWKGRQQEILEALRYCEGG